MARQMKDSGAEWIGEIPEGWKIEKNKHLFAVGKNIVGEKFENYNLLSLTKKGIIIKSLEDYFGKTPESYSTYQSVKKGQVVMCLFDLDMSAVFSGLSDYDGMISPAYKVYECKEDIQNKFAKYWFDFCFDGRKYKIYSKSLRYVVNADDFGDIPILLPNQNEQKKIVDFLDEKVGEIDSVIAKTKETIEDYKRYKQAIITEAVTKGLNPNVEMKESRIEWIGEIPKEWNIWKLKYALKTPMQYGANESGVLYSEELPRYIRITDITSDNKLKTEEKLSLTEEMAEGFILEEGDILFARSGGTVGKSFIYKADYGRCAFAGYLIRATIGKKLLPRYVYYYTLTNAYEAWKSRIFIQSTIQNIGADKYSNMEIVVPNGINQQQKILNYLDEKCSEIDKLIAKKEELLTDLERYKKSLIYEYVTGKEEVE